MVAGLVEQLAWLVEVLLDITTFPAGLDQYSSVRYLILKVY